MIRFKLIIPIIVTGISAFVILQEPAFAQSSRRGRCGDGICGPVERANPKLCPQDCQGQSTIQTPPTAPSPQAITTFEECAKAGYPILMLYPRQCKTPDGITFTEKLTTEKIIPAQISPFGIHGENQYSFDNELRSAGVKVVRYSGGLPAWDKIERTKGNLDWSQLDYLVKTTYDNNIEMMFTVLSFNRWDQGVSDIRSGLKMKRLFPKDVEGYKNFLRTMVERYDGDGIDDASGSPIVTYYQIENEVDGNFWQDTAKNYAKLLEIAYDTIKQANPNAKVIIAGMSVPIALDDFYTDVLNALNKQAFDIFDLHWYGNADNYNNWGNPMLGSYTFKGTISSIRSKLSTKGWNSNMPIWVSETGTYGGKDVVNARGQLLPQQDEKAQASNLIKRYIYYVANGIEVVMWYKMMEPHHAGGIGVANDYFENTGLINNPQNNDGLSHKKLAYYGYKKMIEILSGFSRIETIQESGSVYIYKFAKSGKVIYAVWNDNSQEKQIEILGISSHQVKISEAIPKYESGKDVADYNSAFNTETRAVSGGKATLTLKNVPLFVEEE